MTDCYFVPDKKTSSATICANCGEEKYLHTIGEGIKASTTISSTMSKELTPIEELKDWILKCYPIGLAEQIAEKCDGLLQSESTFIRKKEREAAENTAVKLLQIQRTESLQYWLNKNYPL
jgi:hypothetical protein